MTKDLKSLPLYQLEDAVISCGGKKFHSDYIFSFIHTKDAASLDEITPVPKSLREKLAEEGFLINNLKLAESFTDDDGTEKYVFETFDFYKIETVLLTDDDRRTLCISSQVGCRMGCEFCATAKLGFRRDLTAGEILDQVYQVSKVAGKINNIVYMGMGEPFDNYENTITSAKLLNHPKGRNIGARHITISTCGITERILDFAGVEEQFRLAVSLHAANEGDRSQIMPCSRKNPLKEILSAVRSYNKVSLRRVTFEYCMIKDFNDSMAAAAQLAKVLKGIKCNINLIEYNEHPGCKLQASSHSAILKFQKHLIANGFETHTRFKRGRNIKAACGQLGLLK